MRQTNTFGSIQKEEDDVGFIFLPLWNQLWAVCTQWIDAEIFTGIDVVVRGDHLSLTGIDSFGNLGLKIIHILVEIKRVIRYWMPRIL